MKQTRNTTKRKFKRDRQRQRRRRLFYSIVALIVISLVCYFAVYKISHKIKASKVVEAPLQVPRVFNTPDVKFDKRFGQTFSDMQDVQIVAAESCGITPLTSTDSIGILQDQGLLVRVKDCKYYNTDESELPYLTPLAKELLDEIGRRYHERLGTEQPLRLTGCLRTRESIARLMRRNRNSIPTSCHLFGTTFDISYRYMTYDEKCLLAQALYELQQGGYCYVKYERKQPCFHITVRP